MAAMRTKHELLVGEWAVLGVISVRPAHGYAIAEQLAPTGELGRIWSLSQQLTYRALRTLEQAELIEPAGSSSGRRRVWQPTATGTTELDRWLGLPERRVRDLRPNLLLKLRLLEQLGRSARPLLEVQLDTLATERAAVAGAGDPADALVESWRLAMLDAAHGFVEARLAASD